MYGFKIFRFVKLSNNNVDIMSKNISNNKFYLYIKQNFDFVAFSSQKALFLCHFSN